MQPLRARCITKHLYTTPVASFKLSEVLYPKTIVPYMDFYLGAGIKPRLIRMNCTPCSFFLLPLHRPRFFSPFYKTTSHHIPSKPAAHHVRSFATCNHCPLRCLGRQRLRRSPTCASSRLALRSPRKLPGLIFSLFRWHQDLWLIIRYTTLVTWLLAATSSTTPSFSMHAATR